MCAIQLLLLCPSSSTIRLSLSLPLTIATKYEYAHIELTSQLTSVLVVFSAAGKQLGSEVSTLQITFLALSECGGLGTGTVFGLGHISDFNS